MADRVSCYDLGRRDGTLTSSMPPQHDKSQHHATKTENTRFPDGGEKGSDSGGWVAGSGDRQLARRRARSGSSEREVLGASSVLREGGMDTSDWRGIREIREHGTWCNGAKDRSTASVQAAGGATGMPVGLEVGGRSWRLHNALGILFFVAVSLNAWSLTATRKGFLAVELVCLRPGAVGTTMGGLGFWIGWRRAVSNVYADGSIDIGDLSPVGKALGVLTAGGHAVGIVVNAIGLIVVLAPFAKRKAIEEAASKAMKRLCILSVGLALWLLTLGLVGFLAAVKVQAGATSSSFFAEEYGLLCPEEVTLSFDYAYAMTATVVLCEIAMGLLVLPKPKGCVRTTPRHPHCSEGPQSQTEADASAGCTIPPPRAMDTVHQDDGR
ncbi:unnamed protein product, partial [Discosporangium mesarthrocarpum]